MYFKFLTKRIELMARTKKAKTDEKTAKEEVKAPVEAVEETSIDESPEEAPVEELEEEESTKVEESAEEDAPTEEITEEVIEGNENPVTGETHDCVGEGRIRSISVGGRRMSECIICGNRF